MKQNCVWVVEANNGWQDPYLHNSEMDAKNSVIQHEARFGDKLKFRVVKYVRAK